MILINYSNVDFSVTNPIRSSYLRTDITSLISPLRCLTGSNTTLKIEFFIIDLSSTFEYYKSSNTIFSSFLLSFNTPIVKYIRY